VPATPRSTDAPENRIQAAVRNARAEARAEMEQELGWARSLGPRQDIERYVTLARRLFADPSAFHTQLGSELNQGKPAPVEELVDPKPDLRSEDGKLAYSHEASLAIARNAAERMRRELRQEFAPALQYAQTGTEREAVQQIKAEANATAAEVLGAARQLPHFKEHEVEISRVLSTIDPAVRRKVGSVAALYMAYNKVLAEHVLPTLSATTERQTIADLQRSAHAGASGLAAAPAAPKPAVVRDGNVDDLAKLLERKHAEAAGAH
jgi:hypothetical protein